MTRTLLIAAILAIAVVGCADTSFTDPSFQRRARPEILPTDSLIPTEFQLITAELRRGNVRRGAW